MTHPDIFEFSLKSFENTNSGYKHDFKNIENIPSCGLFSYSELPLSFAPAPGNRDFLIVEVPIKETLELLEGYCELNSFKWYNTRREMSQLDVIFYPWVSVTSEGEAFLMDGRHRLLGMLLLKGMTKALVNIEEHHLEVVKNHFEKLGLEITVSAMREQITHHITFNQAVYEVEASCFRSAVFLAIEQYQLNVSLGDKLTGYTDDMLQYSDGSQFSLCLILTEADINEIKSMKKQV